MPLMTIGAGRALFQAPAVVAAAGAAATTWNSADKTTNLNLSNSDRTVTYGIASNTNEGIRSVAATAASQLVYIEHVIGTISTSWVIGFATSVPALTTGGNIVGASPTRCFGFVASGAFQCADSPDHTGAGIASLASGDRIGIAFNTVTAKAWARKNGGAWNSAVGGSQDPATGDGGRVVAVTGSPYHAWVGMDANTGDVFTTNFATDSWSDAAPSGYTQLAA